jgi:hypothetical protein
MDYADAMNRFNDELSSLTARAEGWDLTIKDIVE